MTGSSSHIDPQSLSALCAYWLNRTHAGDDEEEAASAARGLVRLEPNDYSISADSAFEIGFDFALKVAAAVLSDPFGNLTQPISAAGETTRLWIADFRHEAYRPPTNGSTAEAPQVTV